MTERGLPLSGPVLVAYRAGRKTMTRRVIIPQPPPEMVRCEMGITGLWVGWDNNGNEIWNAYCRYGKPGDILYIQEKLINIDGYVHYAIDNESVGNHWCEWKVNVLPSIFMPKWAARDRAVIVNVRAERLQEIDESDAIVEGTANAYHPDFHVGEFHDYWDSLYAKRGYGWDANPWVWVIEWERMR